MKIGILFLVFATIIAAAKIVSIMEIGFLIAVTMMAIGIIIVKQKNLGSGIVLIGTMALFFNVFNVPLPPQAFPVVYFITALLGLLMALAIIVMITEKAETEVKIEIGYIPDRRKATTA